MFFALLFAASNINAQEESGSNFVWGVRLGMNWATIKNDFGDKFDARTSGVIGVFTRHKLNKSFYVQPEINYTLKGAARRITDNNGVDFDFRLSFDYFEFPVLLKYNFGSTIDSRFKPEIFVGPFLAFRLSASLKLDDVPDSQTDIKDVKSTDYGIAFGTAMGFKVDNVDILLGLRYTLSLTTFDNNVVQFDLRDGKFGVFTITTGFVIN